MKGVHVNWTRPFFERHRLRGHGFKIQRELQDSYTQPTYQILYTVLSVLRWKQFNGPIKLYTDTIGLQFYQSIGVDKLYDEINTEILDNYTEIDAAHFWTSGKIHCLQFETEPFTFLDQDFIVRGKIPSHPTDLAVGHWEIPRGYYYFTREQFNREVSHYKLPDDYNPNAWIPNTSFMQVNNIEVIKNYVEEHKKMVSTNQEVPEWFWLLTDQGVLGHTIRHFNYSVDSLTDKIFLSDSDYGSESTRAQGLSEAWYYPMNANLDKDSLEWEHVWLAKVVYGLNPDFLAQDTKRFRDEIWHVFPEHRELLLINNL
jgi:diadenosine tetraphosphatase ApaH/serine/threonine PP2A family protein phosphatase